MNASLASYQTQAQSSLATAYHPLDWRVLLERYEDIFSYPSLDCYLASQPAFNDNEIGVLTFLYALRQSSSGTREVYAQHVCRFLNHLKMNFYEIQLRHVDIFLDKLIREEKSKNSIKLAFAAVRSFYKSMQAANKSVTNPVNFVTIPKVSYSDKIAHVLKKSLPQESVESILDHLERQYPLRDTAIFYLLARTGIRVSELCNLRWEHLFLSMNKWALSVHGKGGKERIIFLPRNGIYYLLVYRASEFGIKMEAKEHLAISSLPIFSTYRNKSITLKRRAINKLLTKIAVDTGSPHFTPHGLRHTCFTELSHNKTSLGAIRLLAGHENIKTTSIYLDAGEMLASGAVDFDKIERPRWKE